MKKSVRRLLGILFFVLVFQVMFSTSAVFASNLLKSEEFDLTLDYSETIDFYLSSPQYVVLDLYFDTDDVMEDRQEYANITLNHYDSKIQSQKVDVNDDVLFLSNKKLPEGTYSFDIENLGTQQYEVSAYIYTYSSYSSSVTFSSNNVTMVVEDDKEITFKGSPSGSFCAISSVTSSNKKICDCDIEYDNEGKDDIYLSAEGIGKAVIKVKLRTGKTYTINVTVVPPSKPKLSEKSTEMYMGEKSQLFLYHGGKGKVKWKSSRKSVASVSSKGVVKAKKIGTCNITATYKGKKYKCKVKVVRREPDFFAELSEYKTRSNCFVVWFRNNDKRTLTILSGKKVQQEDYKSFDRNIRLKKKIKIKPGATKSVKFYVKGGTTHPSVDTFKLFYKFKYDGKTYDGRVTSENSHYKKGKKWVETYDDDGLYEYWLDD